MSDHEQTKPNLNRPFTQFPEQLATFAELFSNYLPENFFELTVADQFIQILNASDQVLKPGKNYILVDADMTLRQLFTE